MAHQKKMHLLKTRQLKSLRLIKVEIVVLMFLMSKRFEK
jgi:hypothetical protein